MPPESASWDIVSGVGVTALGAAGMRAVEGHHPAPLVRDPYAATFVEAAADQLPGRIPLTPQDAAADPAFPWLAIAQYVAVRSKFFDDFFGAAARAGVSQSVILAAGLDTRAFRLGWLPGATVYEVDAPMVLAFKDSVLAGQGAVARCDRRTVVADLRADWSTALRKGGFNPAEPTAWLAEGLFPYVGDEEMEWLLGYVHKLSAPGSRIAADHMPGGTNALGGSLERGVIDRADEELTTLWSVDRHHDPASWLLGHGWIANVSKAASVASAYGRPMSEAQAEKLRVMQLITAELN